MQNISNKMAKGAIWMVAFKLIERSIGLVSTIILARLLEPADFGLVAMATAFLGLLMLLTSFSFDVVLIQKLNPGRHLYDTAWTFNVIFGASLAVLLVIAAIPLAQFYNEVRLEKILYVLAFSTFLGGFSNIGPVAFRKDLQFHKEFYFQLAKKLMGFTVCMFLAFSLRNYWALVWGTFAGNIMAVMLSYKVHPYRPRFCFRGRKELFGFSMWLFVNNTLFFAYNRMADFIISKLLGSNALGIFTVAYEISNLPTTELVAPINRAVLPGYSKLAHDTQAIRQGFLNVLSIIALCAIPAGVGIALVSESLVMVVLGDKWLETVPLIRLLALSGALTALQTNCSVIYNALGKPRYMSAILFVHVFLLFIPMLVLFLEHEGVLGVAKAYLYSNLIILAINYFVSIKLLGIRVLKVFSVLWRPIFSACGMFFCVKEIMFQLDFFNLSNLAYLLINVGVGFLVYSSLIIGLWILSRYPDGGEFFILKKLKFIKSL